MARSNKPSSTPGRAGWAEPTKGLAMFMVVSYHATLYLQTVGVDAVLGRAKLALELFPMPAFFVIAGIFAARHAQHSFRFLWVHRLLPLLYLYVLWSIIRTVFYFVVPGLNGELGEIPATHPLALPLIFVWPSSSYWFLYALFLFTLLRWLIAGAPAWAQLAGSAAVSSLFSSGMVDSGNIGWNRVGALFFFFVVGALLARRMREAVPRARWPHVAVAGTVFLAATALIVVGLGSVPLVVLAGQLAAVAVGILAAARLARFRPFALLTTVGVGSLRIYLLHLFIIVPTVALIGLLNPAWPRWVDVGVQMAMIVAAFAGSLGLARLTSRTRWLYLPPAFLRGASGRGQDDAVSPPHAPRPADPIDVSEARSLSP